MRIFSYVVVVLGVMFCSFSIQAADLTLPRGIISLEKRAVPELKLADMDGNKFDLVTTRGHWTFVHFWASWCGPCRKEMPSIQRLVRHMEKTPWRVVIINTAETDDTVFSFLGEVAPDLQTLMDYNGLATERWKPRGLPSTYLVDPDGFIRYQALGGRPWDTPAYTGFLERLSQSK